MKNTASAEDLRRTECQRIVSLLGSSPLFNVSLGAKELFHSDFLAWLCEKYPQEAGRIFARFLKEPQVACDGLRARREKRHVDLSLLYRNGETLVIENKVKSLPSKEQLEEISAGCRNPATTSFLLLSLVPPPFLSPAEGVDKGHVLCDGARWQLLSYGQLALDLRAIVPQIGDTYHRALVEDYIRFIQGLDELQSALAIDWANDQSNFFIPDGQMKLLRSIRIHDLVDKLRFSQLLRRIGDLLREQGFNVSYGKVLANHRAGDIVLDTGMTNGAALALFKYVLVDAPQPSSSVILGVEAQGEKFRIAVEMPDKSRAERGRSTNTPASSSIATENCVLCRQLVWQKSLSSMPGRSATTHRFSGSNLRRE